MMIRLLALLALLCFSLAGCKPIKAWQRETLAHPCMVEDSRPEENLARAHILGARESSAGATGETGGGCGCN